MRGVFFMANDAIFDQCIAFLTSFRLNNPDIPLIMIPFDDAVTALLGLQTKYNFSIWKDDVILRQCDALCTLIKGRPFGHFRKLACWEGPFDEFIYVDSDTVILESFDPLFAYLSEFGFVASHSNIASIRKWVWKDSIVPGPHLSRAQIEYSANTGFMCSKKTALSLEDALQASSRLSPVAHHLATELIDQPFLNYLVVTSGIEYSSLYSIFLKNRSADIPLERWGGRDLGPSVNGRFLKRSFPRILLVHWAGEWRQSRAEGRQIHNFALWDFYRGSQAHPKRFPA